MSAGDWPGGYQGPGRYEHHKGGMYRVHGISRNKDTGERNVIYESLEFSGSTIGDDDFWQHAPEDFDRVEPDGRPRFRRVH